MYFVLCDIFIIFHYRRNNNKKNKVDTCMLQNGRTKYLQTVTKEERKKKDRTKE